MRYRSFKFKHILVGLTKQFVSPLSYVFITLMLCESSWVVGNTLDFHTMESTHHTSDHEHSHTAHDRQQVDENRGVSDTN